MSRWGEKVTWDKGVKEEILYEYFYSPPGQPELRVLLWRTRVSPGRDRSGRTVWTAVYVGADGRVLHRSAPS